MRRIPKTEKHRGKYRVRVSTGGGKRRSRSFVTEGEAQAWAARVMAGDVPVADQKMLIDAIQLVLDEAVAARACVDTMAMYEEQTNTILSLLPGETPLVDILPSTVRAFVMQRNESVGAGTVAKNVAMLRRVLRRARTEGWIDVDPLDRCGPLAAQIGKRHQPKPHPPIRAAVFDSCLERMREAGEQNKRLRCAGRDADAMLIIWSTALRRREFADVRVKHADVWTGRIQVDPKRSGDVVYAVGEAKAALMRLCEGRDPEARLLGTKGAVSQMFKRWAKRLGVPELKAHSLRHGIATHMVEQGVQLPDLQKFMRHATPAMTLRYYHQAEDRLAEVAAVSQQRGRRGLGPAGVLGHGAG